MTSDTDEVRGAIAFGIAATSAGFNGDTVPTDPAGFTARLDELVAQYLEQDPLPDTDERVMMRTGGEWLHGRILEKLATRVRVEWDNGSIGSILLADARVRLIREPRAGQR